MTVLPTDIRLNGLGLLTDTLGQAELEAAAALIVRWHHVHELKDWQPVSRQDVLELFESDDVAQAWATNPFWRPAPFEFMNAGFIVGWSDSDAGVAAKGTLTQKFLDALQVRADKDRARKQNVLLTAEARART